MTAWEYMRELHSVCHFWQPERARRASNSDLKRWLENGAVLFNGELVAWDEAIDFRVWSLVLWPKSPRRTTIL